MKRMLFGTLMLASLCFASSMLVTAFALVGEQTPQERVPVFVRSAQSTSGFSDPSKARQDSVKDLVKKLRDSKGMRAVEDESLAVIRIEVLDRETKRESNLFGRQNKSYLTVRVSAGEYVTEFTGESGSKGLMKGYGDAAGKIVKQLDEWVSTNRAKLAEIKPTTEAPK